MRRLSLLLAFVLGLPGAVQAEGVISPLAIFMEEQPRIEVAGVSFERRRLTKEGPVYRCKGCEAKTTLRLKLALFESPDHAPFEDYFGVMLSEGCSIAACVKGWTADVLGVERQQLYTNAGSHAERRAGYRLGDLVFVIEMEAKLPRGAEFDQARLERFWAQFEALEAELVPRAIEAVQMTYGFETLGGN